MMKLYCSSRLVSSRLVSSRLVSKKPSFGLGCKLLLSTMVSATLLSGCADSSDTVGAEPYYTADGFLISPGGTKTTLYKTNAKIDPRLFEYNPPPEGVVLDDSIPTGTTAERFASNIEYVPQGGRRDDSVCGTFPNEAKPAVAAALNIWSAVLNSPVPIRVSLCWATNLSAGTLGEATPTNEVLAAGGIRQPVALANALAGRDILPAETDIEVTINSRDQWHFSPTTAIPTNQLDTHTDLTTVLLHEIGHSLGIMASHHVGGGRARWWHHPANYGFDTFLRDGNGNSLTNNAAVYPNNSAALLGAFQSGQVNFHGAHAMAANGRRPVSIFSPRVFQPGSSIHHVDDETFQRTTRVGVNRLMTSNVSTGDRNHNPGPIAIGIMRDIGWGRVPAPATPPRVATLRAPTGVAVATPTYQWLPALNASDYLLRITNANTNVIVSQQWVMASAARCQTGVCTYQPRTVLPSGSSIPAVLPAGNYRWDVQARSAGGTGAFSAVMNFTVRPSAPPYCQHA